MAFHILVAYPNPGHSQKVNLVDDFGYPKNINPCFHLDEPDENGKSKYKSFADLGMVEIKAIGETPQDALNQIPSVLEAEVDEGYKRPERKFFVKKSNPL